MSIAATATMVLMLLLLAGFWTIQSVLVASLDVVEQNFELGAYLYQNVTQSQVDQLVGPVDAMPETLVGRPRHAATRRSSAFRERSRRRAGRTSRRTSSRTRSRHRSRSS